MPIVKMFVMLSVCFALTGCHRHEDAHHDPDHDHDHGGHNHGVAESEVEPITTTLFTDKVALFMEYPHIVKGEPARFLVHLTVLATGEPVSVGSVTFEATSPQNTKTVVKLDGPKRDGLFIPEVTFNDAGKYKAQLVIRSPLVEDVVDLESLIVHTDAAFAHAAAEAAAEEEPTGAIPFLLEQQWKIKMLSATVGKRTLIKRLSLPAQIAAAHGASAVVSPPVAGRLLPSADGQIPRVGDAVQKGQIVAEIEPPLLLSEAVQLQVKEFELRREIADAQARLEIAERRFQRIEKLRLSGTASEQQMEEAELNLSTAKLGIESARQLQQLYGETLRQLSSNPSTSRPATTMPDIVPLRMPLRAPISGRVVKADHIQGGHIGAHEEVLRIVNADPVWVLAQISEFDLRQIQGSPQALVIPAAYPEKSIDIAKQGGKLVDIGTIIDPDNRTVTIRYELPNPDQLLRIGMLAEVRIETSRSENVLCIPEQAIVMDNGRPTAYVMLEGETFQKRDLVIGLKDAGFVEVRSGLKEGERVATRGAYEIKLASLSPASFGHGHVH